MAEQPKNITGKEQQIFVPQGVSDGHAAALDAFTNLEALRLASEGKRIDDLVKVRDQLERQKSVPIEDISEDAVIGVAGTIDKDSGSEKKLTSREENVKRSRVLVEPGPERDAYIATLENQGLIAGGISEHIVDQLKKDNLVPVDVDPQRVKYDIRNLVILPDGRFVPSSDEGHAGILARHYDIPLAKAVDTYFKLHEDGGGIVLCSTRKGKEKISVTLGSLKDNALGPILQHVASVIERSGKINPLVEITEFSTGKEITVDTGNLQEAFVTHGIVNIE